MRKYFFALSILLFTTSCFAPTYDFIELQSPLTPQKKRQGIFLYGIDHKPDKKEFEELVKVINEVDEQAEKASEEEIPLYIMVEQWAIPHRKFVKEGLINASIQEGLVPLAEKGFFKKTKVISCEVRKISKAAGDLIFFTEEALTGMIKELEDEDFKAFYDRIYGCRVTALTFQHLCDDFEEHYQKMAKIGEGWRKENAAVAAEFEKSLNFARKEYNWLLHVMKLQQIDHNQLIHEYSRKLFREKDVAKRGELSEAIRNAFRRFVDLFVYDQILTLQKQNVKNIAVFVGGGHSHRISDHLYDSAYTSEYLRGISDSFKLKDFQLLKKSVLPDIVPLKNSTAEEPVPHRICVLL